MNHASDRAEVDETVQGLPALSAEAADPSFCRCDCERDEQNESGEANGNEPAFCDVSEHLVEIEKFVQPDIREEMKHAVEEGEQTKHPAIANQPKLASQLSDWGDSKRD